MNKRPLIKFCGMKDNATIARAVDLGVNYLGFVVDFPKSPRSINAEDFFNKVKWLRKNHDGNYKVVAVTADLPIHKLEAIISSGAADVMQLHGKEHVSICRLVRGQIETWKAINTKSAIGEEELKTLGNSVDKILLDSGSAVEKAKNTSGAFDSEEVYNMATKLGFDIVLSGGLEANTIQSYLKKFNPAVIDVSRGIESEPGVKSKQKMLEFMNAVNSYYNEN